MEIILSFLLGYTQCLLSWWWVALSIMVLMTTIVSVIRNDDDTLLISEAIQLAAVGLLALIPFVKRWLPLELRVDILTRWMMLEFCSFKSFVAAFGIISFFAMPIMFILVFGSKAFDYIMSTAFVLDAQRYGLKKVMKRKFFMK